MAHGNLSKCLFMYVKTSGFEQKLDVLWVWWYVVIYRRERHFKIVNHGIRFISAITSIHLSNSSFGSTQSLSVFVAITESWDTQIHGACFIFAQIAMDVAWHHNTFYARLRIASGNPKYRHTSMMHSSKTHKILSFGSKVLVLPYKNKI